jgi:hypothetical protein
LYDTEGRISSLTETIDYISNGSIKKAEISNHYSYANDGRLTSSYISFGTRLDVTYTYDLLNRVSKLEYASNTSNGLENLNQYTYVSSSLDAVSTSGQISRHLSYVFKGSYTVASNTYNYTYGNSALGDRLTAYRGVGITYDAIGNPLSYYNGTSYTFTWNGRQLATAAKGSNLYTFVYDSDGICTEKTVNSVKARCNSNKNLSPSVLYRGAVT